MDEAPLRQFSVIFYRAVGSNANGGGGDAISP
jgi:hypothetical protein